MKTVNILLLNTYHEAVSSDMYSGKFLTHERRNRM